MRLLLTAIIFAGISGAASAGDAENGMAWIDVSLDSGGNVLDASVEQAPTALMEPIESWARATTFEPAVVDGQSVPSTTSVSLEFSLEEAEGGYGLRFLAYTRGPRPVKTREPRYPRRGLEKGLEGRVRINFTVSATGDVEDPSVVESSDKSFDRAAMQSIKHWKFKVPTANGNAVSTVMEQTIEFRIER